MRVASPSDKASGFSRAMARTPCFTPSSTSSCRTAGGVAKQSTLGRSLASISSGSVYRFRTRSSSATRVRRSASRSHTATRSKRGPFAIRPSACALPRGPQPTSTARYGAVTPVFYEEGGAALTRLSPRGASAGPSVVEQLIVEPRDQVAHHEPEGEPIAEPDQAPHEGDPIADEELAQETQVGADDRAPLQDEPVGHDEDSQTADEPGDDTVDRRAHAQQSGDDDLFDALAVLRHASPRPPTCSRTRAAGTSSPRARRRP